MTWTIHTHTETETDNSAMGRALTHNKILSQVIHPLPCIIHESVPEALHSVVNSLGDWLPCHSIKQSSSSTRGKTDAHTHLARMAEGSHLRPLSALVATPVMMEAPMSTPKLKPCGFMVMSSSQACRTRPYDQHAPYRLGGCLCWGIKRPLVQPVVHLQPLHTPVRHPKSQTERCWNDGPVGAKTKGDVPTQF
ncbi:MAG: hypothetical protein FRX49_11653 [Trebouxia sp. A1-2]|nr:MAG: hypothetical protein FRX49_11653 [Trebouxia sp. A1-2]